MIKFFNNLLPPKYMYIKVSMFAYKKLEEYTQKMGYNTTLDFLRRFFLVGLTLIEMEWQDGQIFVREGYTEHPITFKSSDDNNEWDDWKDLLA